MSLETFDISAQNPKEHPLTPEIMKSLEHGTEISVEHLGENNIALLEKAKLIISPEKQKEIVMKLGKISIGAAKAIEELKRKLKDEEIGKLN